MVHGVHAILAKQDFHQFEGEFEGRTGTPAGHDIAVDHYPLFGIIDVIQLVLDGRVRSDNPVFQDPRGVENNGSGANGGYLFAGLIHISNDSLYFFILLKIGGPTLAARQHHQIEIIVIDQMN